MDRKHRHRLRQIKGLSVQVKKLSLKESDLLVLRYDSSTYTVSELNELFQTLATGLNRDIITLPATMDLTVEERKDLIAELQSFMKGGTE